MECSVSQLPSLPVIQEKLTLSRTDENKQLLLICDQYLSIIEDRRHNSNAINEKKCAWATITAIYNATIISKDGQKTEKQLRKRWDNAKGKLRKNVAAEIKQRIITGGGTPPPPVNDEGTSEMIGILKKRAMPKENPMDDDESADIQHPRASHSSNEIDESDTCEVFIVADANESPELLNISYITSENISATTPAASLEANQRSEEWKIRRRPSVDDLDKMKGKRIKSEKIDYPRRNLALKEEAMQHSRESSERARAAFQQDMKDKAEKSEQQRELHAIQIEKEQLQVQLLKAELEEKRRLLALAQ